MKRVGRSAEFANVSWTQLIRLITKAQEKTARGGAVIGNSLKTMFTRLQYLDTLDGLERYGINVRVKRGGYRQPVTILREISKSWPNYTQHQKSKISELLGGVYQVNVVRAIFNE